MFKLKIDRIYISNELIAELSQLSESHFPEESCAILFGRIEGNGPLISHVTKIAELANIIHSEVEFRWDDMEFYSMCTYHTKKGLSLVGIFHSHPDDPFISEYDRTIMKHTGKLYPELVWVVYGNQTHSFKAFTIQKTKRFKEIPIISSD